MKKCPEKEILMAFADGELDKSEVAEITAHLKACQTCAREVSDMSEDDNLLREGVNSVFTRHRVNERIMSQIRSNPVVEIAPAKKTFWQRMMLPALAIGLILLIAVMMIPAERKYHGTADSVSFQALNTEATVDGMNATTDRVFPLSACCAHRLNGDFLFVTDRKSPAEFRMQGIATVKLENAVPSFEEADIELDLVNGDGLQILVNGEKVELTAGMVNFRSLPKAVPASQTFSAGNEPAAIEPVRTIAAASATVSEPVASTAVVIDTTAAEMPASASETAAATSTTAADAVEPVDTVDHITNPFTEEPLGDGR
ncbi:MAG TPA: zf-HC2 domain-containing protein [Candidatus Ozemobacteraceae bacterium]|nr:zf-HC2 domain-containing protein [Candidatus Ozemobacteraceae bacterium]